MTPNQTTTGDKNWWLILIKGLIYSGLGILAIFNPFESLMTLIALFGFFLIASGVVMSIFAITNRQASTFVTSVIKGIIDIIVGVVLISYPETIVAVFNIFFAILIIASGLYLIVQSFRYKGEVRYWPFILVPGLALLIAGGIIFFFPVENAVALTILIGISILIFGISVIIRSFQVKNQD